MHFVVTESIKKVKNTSTNIVSFEDGLSEYQFNISKSTLYKRFYNRSQLDFDVKIFDNPFDILESLYAEKSALLEESEGRYDSVIYLPLFSEKGERHVPDKSGLNQWNAGGRTRSEREVYIPIPAWIHKEYPEFFPQRDKPFNLKLPTGAVISAKVCQDGSKALMSNPNTALGGWLIDDVLKAEPGKVITIEQLDALGIDSVEVRKIDDENFEIDFKETGTYEEFKEFVSK